MRKIKVKRKEYWPEGTRYILVDSKYGTLTVTFAGKNRANEVAEEIRNCNTVDEMLAIEDRILEKRQRAGF